MMVIEPGKRKGFLRVTNPDVDPNYLLGATQVKGQDVWNVEANLINLYQLGELGGEKTGSNHWGYTTEHDQERIGWLEERLFDYQRADIARMTIQKTVLNANPMGYGKTVETIVTLKALGVRNALIIAPKSVLLHWERFLREWWPEYRGEVAVLTSSTGDWKATRNGIVITNYEALLQPRRLAALRMFTWDILILDEAHRIKNRKSKRWANIADLPRQRCIELTGTPILRYVDDLWALLYTLNPMYSGGSYWKFVEFFCNVEQGPWGRKVGALSSDPKKVALLNWLMGQVSIRNQDLKLTPGKRQAVVDLELEDAQRKLYEKAKDLILEELPEDCTITTAMTHLLRLRQITSCPEQFDPKCGNAKLEWIKATLEDNEDLKIVLMSSWSQPLYHFAEALNKYPTEEFMQLYTGDYTPEEREEAKRRFIEDPQARILGGTIGALGQGVDGLQLATNTIVFLDRDWSPEINSQAEDRINRLGQTEVVNCYYLECIGTIDRHVARINLSKASDIRAALME